MENDWIESSAQGTLLRLFIQPRSSKTEIAGLHGTPPRLKIRVAAPPVEGEANDEVLRFLRKKLGLPSARIGILRGESSRQKDVLCAGIAPDQVRAALGIT